MVNQADVACKVRCLIAKWQRSQKDVELRELKEHEHFDVKVRVKVNVSMLCKMCGKLSVLRKVKGCVMILNWTRHVVKCVPRQGKTSFKQLTLSPSPSSSSSSTSLSLPKVSPPSPAFGELCKQFNQSDPSLHGQQTEQQEMDFRPAPLVEQLHPEEGHTQIGHEPHESH